MASILYNPDGSVKSITGALSAYQLTQPEVKAYQSGVPYSTMSRDTSPVSTGASTQQAVTTQYKPLDPALISKITAQSMGQGMANDPNQVHLLQQALVAAGYMNQADIDAQGGVYNYGPLTKAAVIKWQQSDPQLAAATGANAGYFGPISKSFVAGKGVDPTAPIISGKDTKPQNTGVTDGSQLPPGVGPDGLANSGISTMNEDAFGSTVKQLKVGTPEWNAAMDKINVAYYDVLQQQMNANTEQEQQAAQYNWESLKKNIETNLNIKLSGDALQAWDQVQNLKDTYGKQNIEGSGLQNEATDDYLRRVRLADSQMRTGAKTEEEQKNMDYYTKFANPEQIKALIATNPELAKKWGLIPSADVKNAMSFSSLKAKYPNVPDADINAYIAQVVDENGNYRSNLYQRKMTGNSIGASPGNTSISYNADGTVRTETVTPSDYGVVDINAAMNQYKGDMVQNSVDAAMAAEKLKKDGPVPTDTSHTFYSQPASGSAGTPNGTATPSNPLGNTGTTAAASVASTMGTGTVKPTTTTPARPDTSVADAARQKLVDSYTGADKIAAQKQLDAFKAARGY
jgi:hypothetical protein